MAWPNGRQRSSETKARMSEASKKAWANYVKRAAADIRKALASGGAGSTEARLQCRLGWPATTISRAIQQLASSGVIRGAGRRNRRWFLNPI